MSVAALLGPCVTGYGPTADSGDQPDYEVAVLMLPEGDASPMTDYLDMMTVRQLADIVAYLRRQGMETRARSTPSYQSRRWRATGDPGTRTCRADARGGGIMRRSPKKRWPLRLAASLSLMLLAGSIWVAAGVFEENWDSVGQGGDGINSFTMGPLFPSTDPVSVDGSRCQYSDPANPDSQSRLPCQPWNGSDWHVHLPVNSPEGKSFSGDGALHMGRHPRPDDATWDDYTTSQLSVAVSPPITLDVSPGVQEGPNLSFWHIAALADLRTFGSGPGTTYGRAIVQLALADADGNILSDWQNIQAFKNPYTGDPTTRVNACFFDPIDDGTTEDDVTTPPGQLPLGPSSTCTPELAFHYMGDWTSSNRKDTGFADSNVGKAGNLGSGIWVQSRFDLQAYEGETIRIRLLFTGVDIQPGLGWSDLFGNRLGNATRGWILDDFRLTGTTEP